MRKYFSTISLFIISTLCLLYLEREAISFENDMENVKNRKIFFNTTRRFEFTEVDKPSLRVRRKASKKKKTKELLTITVPKGKDLEFHVDNTELFELNWKMETTITGLKRREADEEQFKKCLGLAYSWVFGSNTAYIITQLDLVMGKTRSCIITIKAPRYDIERNLFNYLEQKVRKKKLSTILEVFDFKNYVKKCIVHYEIAKDIEITNINTDITRDFLSEKGLFNVGISNLIWRYIIVVIFSFDMIMLVYLCFRKPKDTIIAQNQDKDKEDALETIIDQS
ncbi:hypothetical protein SNEBB_003100 [Seison nebaliae]|nr:hypothetical protein SNEBB_003100 [Seison nebaliae]